MKQFPHNKSTNTATKTENSTKDTVQYQLDYFKKNQKKKKLEK